MTRVIVAGEHGGINEPIKKLLIAQFPALDQDNVEINLACDVTDVKR